MKNNILKSALVVGIALVSLSSCTKNFEEINKNPYGGTNDDFAADLVPLKLVDAQLHIYVNDPAWVTQLQQNLMGDSYSGYMTPPTPFASNINNITYSLVDGWNSWAWNPAYDNVMNPISYVEEVTRTGDAPLFAMAKIIKVEAMHRVSDIFGPIIYTKYKVPNPDGTIDYDSQQDAYTAFFSDLDSAVNILTPIASQTSSAFFQKSDKVYGGDYAKWLKFANTLRLRLALRIVKADPEKAKMEGEKALSNAGGLLATNADNFNVDFGTTPHPLNVFNNDWGDIRMGAPMESILGGYSDPRLPKYFQPAIDPAVAGLYKGIRGGVDIDAKARYADYSKLATFENKAQMMTAAEAWFLKAEAAIRGWAGAGDAKTDYETGITTSFTQYGLSGSAAAYVANSTAKPKEYKDPKSIVAGENDILTGSPWLSTATIQWDDAATMEQKLEKIITQKWIAMYPDGQEAWSEFRRTGYPKLFPVVKNYSNGKIPTNTFIRRINFTAEEYSANKAAVDKAISLLGGEDNGGTRLWWDKP